MRIGALWVLLVAVSGCGGASGPASTDTSSTAIPSLDERIEFLQRYVKFRRHYRALDFRVVYRNNSGGRMPGPSEWDIRIVADVPPQDLASWVPPGAAADPKPSTAWLAGVPGAERAAGVTEWYSSPGQAVGLDRARSVVAFRAWAY